MNEEVNRLAAELILELSKCTPERVFTIRWQKKEDHYCLK